MNDIDFQICDPCIQRKFTKHCCPTELLDEVHSDLCEHLKLKQIEEWGCFIAIIDD